MIRIAITGPESSGKTSLSESLSAHYSGDLVQEYAREFLVKLNRPYIQSDLDKIAEGHLEKMLLSQNSIQFVDTDFVVLHTWSLYKFKSVSPLIKELTEQDYFDLTIVCSPDIPWEPDPLRENPENRKELFQLYIKTLKKINRNYIVVNESHHHRLQESIRVIDQLLSEIN